MEVEYTAPSRRYQPGDAARTLPSATRTFGGAGSSLGGPSPALVAQPFPTTSGRSRSGAILGSLPPTVRVVQRADHTAVNPHNDNGQRDVVLPVLLAGGTQAAAPQHPQLTPAQMLERDSLFQRSIPSSADAHGEAARVRYDDEYDAAPTLEPPPVATTSASIPPPQHLTVGRSMPMVALMDASPPPRNGRGSIRLGDPHDTVLDDGDEGSGDVANGVAIPERSASAASSTALLPLSRRSSSRSRRQSLESSVSSSDAFDMDHRSIHPSHRPQRGGESSEGDDDDVLSDASEEGADASFAEVEDRPAEGALNVTTPPASLTGSGGSGDDGDDDIVLLERIYSATARRVGEGMSTLKRSGGDNGATDGVHRPTTTPNDADADGDAPQHDVHRELTFDATLRETEGQSDKPLDEGKATSGEAYQQAVPRQEPAEAPAMSPIPTSGTPVHKGAHDSPPPPHRVVMSGGVDNSGVSEAAKRQTVAASPFRTPTSPPPLPSRSPYVHSRMTRHPPPSSMAVTPTTLPIAESTVVNQPPPPHGTQPTLTQSTLGELQAHAAREVALGEREALLESRVAELAARERAVLEREERAAQVKHDLQLETKLLIKNTRSLHALLLQAKCLGVAGVAAPIGTSGSAGEGRASSPTRAARLQQRLSPSPHLRLRSGQVHSESTLEDRDPTAITSRRVLSYGGSPSSRDAAHDTPAPPTTTARAPAVAAQQRPPLLEQQTMIVLALIVSLTGAVITSLGLYYAIVRG